MISYSAPGPRPWTATARVLLARTSEPPCFSVIAMPQSAPSFSLAGRIRGSYSSDVKRGSHSRAISGCARNAGTAEYVIEIGQPKPASAWLST